MPVKRKKTFIRKTTEKKDVSKKPAVNEKETITEEIETTEQIEPAEEKMELEAKVEEAPVQEGQSDEELVQDHAAEEETQPEFQESTAEEAPSRLEKIAEEQSIDEEKNESKNSFLWGVLPVVILAVAIIGGFFLYNLGVKNGKEQAQKALPIESPIPSPTEVPLTLNEFSIKVLNGSGVGGEAAKVDDLLTAAGFKVSSTGNAQTSDYEKTLIEVKDKVSEVFVKKLMDELGKTYDIDKTAKLDDSESTDVIVTVGSSKAQ